MKALLFISVYVLLLGFSPVQSAYYSDHPRHYSPFIVCYAQRMWRRFLGYNYVPQCESIISYKLEQTDGDLKWCVNSDGTRIPYTTYTIESFPFDCEKIQDCPYGTVYENTGRCEGTCAKAGIEEFYCHNNCICPRGMFRNKEKKCIELADCKSELETCAKPKVYVKCATRCPATCETPIVDECKDGCNENLHCVCPNHMVQMSKSNKTCLRPANCPKCENGAVYSEHSKACPDVCPSLEEPCTTSGINREQHCVCPPGKVQINLKSVICVSLDHCPPICPFPKELNEKSCPKCQATCDNRKPVCDADCELKRACECSKGYVLLKEDGKHCVKESECPDERCEEPKVYTNCASSCPPTCLDPKPEFCQRDCRLGVTCVCPDNMVQPDADTFSCILPSQCPDLCEESKVYEKCPAPCQPTCQKPNPDQDLCVGCAEDKCICPKDLVLISETERKCVELAQCGEYLCESPKMYDPCPTSCPQTCERMESESCTEACASDKCVCPKGMVLLSESNRKCVKPSECPVKCDKPKVFAHCASYCPPTCDDPFPEVCTRACNPKILCICPFDMVQQSMTNTTCIKLNECPSCPHPKIYRDCASKCQPTCETPNPAFCTEECAEGLHCVCPPGFVHPDNRNDSCIPLSSCPATCPYPLLKTSCASKCPSTCDDPLPTCEKGCVEGVKCVCPKGLLQMSLKNMTCVLPRQCPNLRKDCPLFKMPTRCASGCPATCQTPKPRFCTKKCKPDVNCECEDGMVQKSLEDDTCVYPRQCQEE